MTVAEIFQQPRSAADPRPGGRPFYIEPACPTCSTLLVLLDQAEHPSASESEVWFDEWVCPQCRGGVFMDWPAGEWAAVREADASIALGDYVTLEEVRRELGLEDRRCPSEG